MNIINIIYNGDLSPFNGININSITFTKEEVIVLDSSIKERIIELIKKYINIELTENDLINGVNDSIDIIIDILIFLFLHRYPILLIDDKDISKYRVGLYNILMDIALDIKSKIIFSVSNNELIKEIEQDIKFGLFPDYITLYKNKNELIDYTT